MSENCTLLNCLCKVERQGTLEWQEVYIHIVNGRIDAVDLMENLAEQDFPSSEYVFRNLIVLPALTNAHVHFGEALWRGQALF